MVRTVRVRLELDKDDFKSRLRESASDMREFDAGVKTLGGSVERTGTQLKETGATSRKMADDVKASKVETLDLGKELETTRGKLQALGDEYKRTGSVELQRYRDLTREMGKLERAKRDLDKLITPAAAIAPSGAGGLGGLVSKLPGDVLTGTTSLPFGGQAPAYAIAGAITYGAPIIGAAAAAAVLTGLSGATLAGGLALAWSDPKVTAAVSRFSLYAGDALHQAASRGLGNALALGIGDLSKDIVALGPSLERTFSTLAPALTALSSGLGGMLTNVLNSSGWQLAIAEGAKLLTQIGDELPKLGNALDIFFGSMARSGPGAEAFLTFMLHGVEGLIIALGFLTEALTKAFKFGADASSLLMGPLGILLDRIGAFGPTSKSSFNDLRHAAEGAVPPIALVETAQEKLNDTMATAKGRADALKQQFDLLYGGQIGAADASDAYNSSLVTLEDTVTKNTTATGLSQAAIDSHRAAINQAQVSIRSNEAAIAANKGSVDAHKASIQSAQASIESHQAALNNHSGAVNANALSLADNTRMGLDNRQMLISVLKSSNDLTIADVNNGLSTDEVTKKHDARIQKLRDEALHLGFTKDDTDALIKTYDEVPGNVTTDIKLNGVDAVKKQLIDLKAAQLSLADPTLDVGSAVKEVRNQLGIGGGGLAGGGRIPGPPSAVDNVVARTPWGPMGLATGEYVVNARSTSRALPLLDWVNAGMPGMAGGGMWPGYWPFTENVSRTRMPVTLAQLQARYSTGIGAGPGGDWTAVATAVANALGQPGSVGAILRRIAFESGGNPTIVNTTDSNWFAGHPSVGLAQVIAGTYAAYADGHDVGPYLYGVSTNPFANVFAGMNYATHRYGSIAAVDPLNMPSGYAHGGFVGAQSFDRGGWLQPGWTAAYNGTRQAEWVGGGGPVINITVAPAVGATPSEQGAAIVRAIRSFEQNNTAAWRSDPGGWH